MRLLRQRDQRQASRSRALDPPLHRVPGKGREGPARSRSIVFRVARTLLSALNSAHIQLSFQDSSEGHANWIAGESAHARCDLAEFGIISEISRRRLDARALPLLRPPKRRFWRMPLPGFSADGRCQSDRSGLRACALAPPDSRMRCVKMRQQVLPPKLARLPSTFCKRRWPASGTTGRTRSDRFDALEIGLLD